MNYYEIAVIVVILLVLGYWLSLIDTSPQICGTCYDALVRMGINPKGLPPCGHMEEKK